MADTITIKEIPYSTIVATHPYWNRYPIIDLLNKAGKHPSVIHIDVNIDTSAAASGESTKPTNEVLNFTSPMQIYARSSNAADTSKAFKILGQKADGSIGTFSYTTNAADGTTAVDLGTWNFILQPEGVDSCAGNIIIDDDGASNEVYWTLALGATDKHGIIIIPEGCYGAFVTGFATLIADPGSAGEGMHLDAGDIKSYLSRNNPDAVLLQKIGETIPEMGRLSIKTNYESAAVTAAFLHIMIVAWKK